GLVGRLVLPLVELELDRHVVVKDFAALLGRNYAIEFVEEKSVRLTNPLDLQGLRIVVEMPRGNDPGGNVAMVVGHARSARRFMFRIRFRKILFLPEPSPEPVPHSTFASSTSV